MCVHVCRTVLQKSTSRMHSTAVNMTKVMMGKIEKYAIVEHCLRAPAVSPIASSCCPQKRRTVEEARAGSVAGTNGQGRVTAEGGVTHDDILGHARPHTKGVRGVEVVRVRQQGVAYQGNRQNIEVLESLCSVCVCVSVPCVRLLVCFAPVNHDADRR